MRTAAVARLFRRRRAARSQRRFFLSRLFPRFFPFSLLSLPLSLSLSLSFSLFFLFVSFFTLVFPSLLFLGSVPFRLFGRLSSLINPPGQATAAFVNGLQGPDASFPGKNNNSSDEAVLRTFRSLPSEFLFCWRVAFCWRVGSSRGTTGLRGLIGCTMLHVRATSARSLLGISRSVRRLIALGLTKTFPASGYRRTRRIEHECNDINYHNFNCYS